MTTHAPSSASSLTTGVTPFKIDEGVRVTGEHELAGCELASSAVAAG
jgi:hypothetical protein